MSDGLFNAEQLPSLPKELIENIIIPYSPIPWLRISKKYNALAINHVVNDPKFLRDPQSAVVNATYKKNYAILKLLLADERYIESYIISNALNICPADKKANQIFLQEKNCYERVKIRILSRAISHDWIDVVDYIFGHKDETSIPINSFGLMSESIFDRVIHDPKLKCSRGWLTDLSKNSQISESKKFKILTVLDIDMEAVIRTFGTSTFLEVLISDQRVIDSLDLQKCLWNTLINNYYMDSSHFESLQNKIQVILEKKNIDPSIEFNFPLRLVVEKSNFAGPNKDIAQMLLDDDRVILTLEPFDKNVMIAIIRASHSKETNAKIKWMLGQPKFKREWFEPTIEYLLYGQLEDADLDSYDTDIIDPEFIFKEHQFDEYLSEEIRAKYPRAMKSLFPVLASQEGYYNEYYNKMMKMSNTNDDEDKPVE